MKHNCYAIFHRAEAASLLRRLDEAEAAGALALPPDGAAAMALLLRKNKSALALGDTEGWRHAGRPALYPLIACYGAP